MTSGFLVVERSGPSLSRLLPTYRGLYRTPAWNQKAFEAGFDDPLVFGSYTNNHGLIISLSGAQEVLSLLTPVTEGSELELIWTRQTGSTTAIPHVSTFLGIDVACSAPFWSILADPPANTEFVKEHIGKVNRNGLFQDEADARRYLASFRSAHPEKAGVLLYLWDVYSVQV